MTIPATVVLGSGAQADVLLGRHLRASTPAETRAWRLLLSLPQPMWKHARALFKRGHDDLAPDMNIVMFVSESGVTDPGVLEALEAALWDLTRG